MQDEIHAAIVRLSNIPPIHVQAVDDASGEIKTWFWGRDADLQALRLAEGDRARLVALVGVELARWGRAAAATKRVWQVRDRVLREWKAAMIVAAVTPPPGADVENEGEKKKKGGWKQPPQWIVEASYRAEPDYPRLNSLIEQAEEAHTACLGVIEAWQALSRLLERSP